PVLVADNPVAFALGRRKLPVMLFSYVGALRGWLFRLWFLVVPMGVPGHRAFGIVLGLATLWMTYRFVLRFYGRPVALLTTALFSTDPSFTHTMRLDWGLVSLMHVFKMGGLCLLARWLQSRSRASLAGGMFLFGLGLWDKANFIWFLAGLGATLVLLFPREMLERLRGDRAALPIAAAALLVGAAPLVFYNLARSGQTWREHGQLEFRWSKLHQSKSTFEGDFMLQLTGGDDLDSSPAAHDVVFPRLADWMYRLGRCRQTILLPLLGLGLLALPLNLWLAPRGHPRRRLLFPLLLSILIYACMFVSFDGGASVHHVTILLPFPLLFLAESLWTPAERWPRWRLAAAAATIAAVAVNVSLNARHLAVYTRTGGTGGFTDAVYRLVPYLAENPGRKPVGSLSRRESRPQALRHRLGLLRPGPVCRCALEIERR
ncbi:MAG: glycosyltransferase family 39 protein, partial [Acidobacteria bacterium]|nr:glycosyltransferase family 39 protein [Acidobacteriota bacterium]